MVDLGVPGGVAAGFKEGDYIFVSGRSAQIDGRQLLLARYVGKLLEVRP